MSLFYKDEREVYHAGSLDRLEWLDHGFGTRASGFWVADNLVMLRQIHSDRWVYADGRTGMIGDGDALVSDHPGQFLGIRTADCLPLLIADERRRVVAAVHAGWRGTASRIAAKSVSGLGERFGSRPEDLVVAIGPGICRRCYTVGPEVARRFAEWLPELSAVTGQVPLDLAEANRRQLIAAGVPAERITTGAPCTFCQPEDFYSYRRGTYPGGPGTAGRMLSAVGIRAG